MNKVYLKCPLNYTGGKYKLLPQILPYIPKDIENFVDLFCGGCNVAINIDVKDKKYCNDIECHVVDFYKGLQNSTVDEALNKVKGVVDEYKLDKENQDGFNKCREDYNKDKNWYMFYALVSHAFNYQIRYNKKGEYNMPFGKNRSSFNPSLECKFKLFVEELSANTKYVFMNKDFRDVEVQDDSFVYVDPPYLISTAAYNENGGWSEKDEIDLYNYLDKLNDKGIKFMVSNVVEHKGRVNEILREWSKKYTVKYLNYDYSNSSYQGKNKDKPTIEVLVLN